MKKRIKKKREKATINESIKRFLNFMGDTHFTWGWFSYYDLYGNQSGCTCIGINEDDCIAYCKYKAGKEIDFADFGFETVDNTELFYSLREYFVGDNFYSTKVNEFLEKGYKKGEMI